MIYKNKPIKIGQRTISLRSAEEKDAETLLTYMKIIYGETPYLIREPEEVTLTLEQERNFIRERAESERDLMLLVFENETHIGNCSISSLGGFSRYAHRCDMAIALYQKYCGAGIGRAVIEEALNAARDMGYEQAELEVAAGNEPAVRLYESLGFQKYGTFPDNMKYKDGTYEDAYWMMKKL
ncbi:MAG: GNAT family N-acetyltransferase [Lachnospiraceae bacterium]|jgi:RimJ/RimL family protein N-acetyltransferase|nr:GNAT family N-acetyltransferase [Lachnospiraceae bacterium]MCI8871530.1 GNAT family N-acetyltransferase [Lachnospiraceae bacterium]GFI29696.1 putative phosphinothricin acetyltransferase YwnH [Lachnospiraceae bacterium]